ncbi:hypothetical protein ACFY7H_33735 [Streptomyces sp. NPDC012794]|uniref:hypothetical protein n=1 Tax=Streptomyces sp. NPDC012794 TaxID=3364850 RepID=UPI0036798499
MSAPATALSLLGGGRPVLGSWWAGSLVMCRWTCRCVKQAVTAGWTLLRTDPEATRVKQAAADRKAASIAAKRRKAKAAVTGDDDEELAEPEEAKAPPVDPVRRPASDALILLAVGGTAVSGLAGAAAAMVWEYAQLLTPWRPWVVTGAVAVWSIAALMLAPPLPEPVKDDDQEEGEDPSPEGAPAAAATAAEDEAEPLYLSDVAPVVHKIAAANGHRDVHLADLLSEPLFEGWDMADLRAAFTAEWGVPVSEFKLTWKTAGGPPRQRVRPGVRWADIEAALTGAPEAPSAPPAQAPTEAPVEAPVEGPHRARVEAPSPGLYLVHSEPLPEPLPAPRTVAG